MVHRFCITRVIPCVLREERRIVQNPGWSNVCTTKPSCVWFMSVSFGSLLTITTSRLKLMEELCILVDEKVSFWWFLLFFVFSLSLVPKGQHHRVRYQEECSSHGQGPSASSSLFHLLVQRGRQVDAAAAIER